MHPLYRSINHHFYKRNFWLKCVNLIFGGFTTIKLVKVEAWLIERNNEHFV